MKVEIEVIGHAPKQKAAILKMLEDFVAEMPARISVGTVKIKEVGGSHGKQISPKRKRDEAPKN